MVERRTRASVCRDDPVTRGLLGEGPGIRILRWACYLDQRSFHPSRIGSPVVWLALVRSGGFVLRAGGSEEFIDPTTGFLLRPDDEFAFAHPAQNCDISTALFLSQDRYGDSGLAAGPVLPVTAQLDLAHRGLVAACQAGTDQFEITERVHGLLAKTPGTPAATSSSRRIATRRAHRALVNQVRAALIDGPVTASLEQLSRQAGCSPFHLSKVFRLVTGQTLTRYRNQLRVRAVADEIANGQPLRELAAKYGFADQAHLTRVFRQHAGQLPSAVRELTNNLLRRPRAPMF